MRKVSKKVVALIMSVMLVMSLPLTAGATSGTFTAVGGPYCKSWEYSLYTTTVASALYRITGKLYQPGIYKFNEVEMELTLFRSGLTNIVKNKLVEDTYTLTLTAEGAISQCPGNGSMYVRVDDNIYGHYTATYFN
jgi:hypothetical protein